jgi:serine/threonine protein phosphatase PrpC
MPDALCPGCGEVVADDARFCEACGHDLAEPVGHRLATSSSPPVACASCAGTTFAEQPQGGSYCENCGTRRPAGPDHAEVDFGGIAAVSDIGKRHHHNEDAMGVAVLPGAAIAVVCDGVSSSARADTASHAAADAAIRTFVRMLEAAPGGIADAAIAEAAMVTAVGSAQAAAVEVADPNGPGANPPSATFVAAVVTPEAITVGWVGDSRAYWIPDGHLADPAALVLDPVGGLDVARPICMTVDDTLGGQLAAAGVDVSDGAPNMAALVRWLGADATDTSPHVRVFTPAGPGRVIVCSDGLYRYAPDAAALAALTPSGDPIEVARKLVQFALDAGGQDNVTVIVVPYPPPAVL